jgi:hypothetical protein
MTGIENAAIFRNTTRNARYQLMAHFPGISGSVCSGISGSVCSGISKNKIDCPGWGNVRFFFGGLFSLLPQSGTGFAAIARFVFLLFLEVLFCTFLSFKKWGL